MVRFGACDVFYHPLALFTVPNACNERCNRRMFLADLLLTRVVKNRYNPTLMKLLNTNQASA